MKNGAPDIDYLVGNYVMGDENSKYTILKAQYLEVIKRDSKGLCLYKKLTNYVFTKTKSEPNYNHIFQRTKWNVFERDLNTRLVLKNSHNYWPYEITASLKGKAYTYSEVRDVQNTGYTCGPTSSSMCTQVLRCYLNEQFLASKSGTNYYDGSSTVGLKKDGTVIAIITMNKLAELGYNRQAVINCCRGRAKTSAGYIWKYAD